MTTDERMTDEQRARRPGPPPLVDRFFMSGCVRLIPHRRRDGLGGFTACWREGEAFRAAVVPEGTKKASEAGAAREARVYRVTAEPGVALGFHDVFRRERDGAVFRVTGALGRPPACAGFDFAQAMAEEWRLP